MGRLTHFEQQFGRVGWFIPPYIQMQALSAIAADIAKAGPNFTQTDLEKALGRLYEADGMAAMVLHRYPRAPIISDYKDTIGEAIKAHFLKLDHVAVAGLIPVIEGAGRRLAAKYGITERSVSKVFVQLAEACKADSATNNLGAPDEVASMMDSFAAFASNSLFVSSTQYAFDDGTNRHGIAHGAYTDADYGSPINFYKVIAAVDFLTFVSSFRANLSWLGEDVTQESMRLAAYYRALAAASGISL